MTKLIVDTCVWSLWLRRRNPSLLNANEQQILAKLREAVENRRATILGPIRQEVLSGIRDAAQFAKTASLLDPFLDEPIDSSDYIEAAKLFNLCRDHGIQCGPVDILICTVAARNHYGILTYDQGLERCIGVLRSKSILS
ncbi:MAG: PIN domain-containing protein [Terracidiphilus sp.]